MKSISELRVIEVVGSKSGAYTGKLFADQGAEVLLVEPPGGSPARREQPIWQGTSTQFAYLNTSKQSVELDLLGHADQARLKELLASADILIESSAPDPLTPLSLGEPHSRLIRVQISPFGKDGPYAAYRSNEFTDQAIGGQLFLNGEPDREPIQRPGQHASYQSGSHAFIAAMAALVAREKSGIGQEISVSHLEGYATLHQHTTSMMIQGNHIINRVGNGQPGPWHPCGVYPCKDGYVSLAIPTTIMLEPFLRAAGLPEILEDPRFCNDYVRGEHKREFDEVIAPWLMSHTAAEIIALGQSVSAPVGPVQPMIAMAEDEHLNFRNAWQTLGTESPLKFPRPGIWINGKQPDMKAAPEHGTAEGWKAGTSLGEIDASTSEQSSLADGPLTGVRVLDLTRVWAGPLATRMLGDMGADVIKIEASWARGIREIPPEAAERSHLFPDDTLGDCHWNRNAGFNKLNRNKRSVTLELNTPKGRELFMQLVREADVVIENYSPRVMPKLGLDFDSLKEINPHIIYVGMPGFGSTGPYKNWVAFGPLIEAACGLTSIMGYADSGPYRSGVAWPDPVTALTAASGVLLAYQARESDPERNAQQVETPMIEAMMSFIGGELLTAQLSGKDEPRRGNRHSEHAPQGVYPCKGQDRWIAISITSDEEWAALCDTADLADAFRSMNHESRQQNHDAIDEALSSWTSTSSSVDSMSTL